MNARNAIALRDVMGLLSRSLASFGSEPAPAPIAKPLPVLRALVKDDLAAVDQIILTQLDCEEPLIRLVGEHILQAGGKRLRPSLTLAAAHLCGYHGTRHRDLAACVELIHTATLLHDDVVDESHLRRGLATANDLWGNKASVLVGDFLLSRAFQLMVADGNLEVLRILSDASAIISQGEVMQLATANQPKTTEEAYLRVIEAKTAALFAAACEIGAVVAGDPRQNILRQFGMQLGVAFQIMDDALDYAADAEALGKTVGDDFREGKITLPVILAYRDGTPSERDFWARCLERMEQTPEDLAAAIAMLAKHGAIERSIAKARDIIQEAKLLLGDFEPSSAREAMLEVADFSVARAY